MIEEQRKISKLLFAAEEEKLKVFVAGEAADALPIGIGSMPETVNLTLALGTSLKL